MTDRSPDLRETVRAPYSASALKATEGRTACCDRRP